MCTYNNTQKRYKVNTRSFEDGGGPRNQEEKRLEIKKGLSYRRGREEVLD